MNKQWPIKRLGALLFATEDTLEPKISVEYQEITVRLWGKGVVERGRVRGASLAGKRFVAHAGQFIMSRIDARNGAMGLVPTSLEGALVTNDFPLFNLNTEILEPEFFGWLCRTPGFVDLCKRASEGTTNRVRLKEDRFLSLDVHVPSLTEQRKIVKSIDGLAALVLESQNLRREAIAEGSALLRSILAHDNEPKATPMRHLLKLRSPDVAVQSDEVYDFAGVYCFGRGVFKSVKKSGIDFAYKRLTRLRAGEFVYPKLMAWEGALGVVPPECEGCVVSPEFPVFEVFEDRVLPEVLDVYFRNPSVWPEVSRASTGTNVRRRRLNPQDFLAYEMPLPSRDTQLKLRAVYGEMGKLKELQTETAAELESLMPSVLSKAFAGEL